MLRRRKIEIGIYFTPVAKTVWKCGLGFSRDTTLTSTVAKVAFSQKVVQAHFVQIFARFVLALAQRKFKRGAIANRLNFRGGLQVECRNATARFHASL
jgi:hypothetical protein